MSTSSLRHSRRVDSRGSVRWALVIVNKPAGWEPKDWDDEPLFPGELWTERRNLPIRRARGLMFGFNSASLENDGQLWAIIQPDLGRTVGSIGLLPTRN